MSVLERFLYPGILCAAGIYYTRGRIDTLEIEMKAFKESVAEDAKISNASMESVKQGLQALLNRQIRLEQNHTAQTRKCMTVLVKK